eukprot:COSAG01_NODE_9217_length_2515_cov_2.885762_3_plen_285_part_00
MRSRSRVVCSHASITCTPRGVDSGPSEKLTIRFTPAATIRSAALWASSAAVASTAVCTPNALTSRSMSRIGITLREGGGGGRWPIIVPPAAVEKGWTGGWGERCSGPSARPSPWARVEKVERYSSPTLRGSSSTRPTTRMPEPSTLQPLATLSPLMRCVSARPSVPAPTTTTGDPCDTIRAMVALCAPSIAEPLGLLYASLIIGCGATAEASTGRSSSREGGRAIMLLVCTVFGVPRPRKNADVRKLALRRGAEICTHQRSRNMHLAGRPAASELGRSSGSIAR